MLRGANEIVDHVKRSIGVERADQVSADGLFSFEEVECLGACEYAPMMRLDHRYHYDLTPDKIDQLVAEANGGGIRLPAGRTGRRAAPGGKKQAPPSAVEPPLPSPPQQVGRRSRKKKGPDA